MNKRYDHVKISMSRAIGSMEAFSPHLIQIEYLVMISFISQFKYGFPILPLGR